MTGVQTCALPISTWLDSLGAPFTAPTRPLLFDSGYAAKPAYTAVRNRVAAVAVSGRAVPPTPTIGSVTQGAGSIAVAFTPGPTGAFAASAFTASCASTDGGITGQATGSASPIIVTGLTNTRTYRCTVRATNLVGSSPVSAQSAAVLVGVPSVPPNVRAVAAPGQVTITWSPPTVNGGSPVTGYLVTPIRNGIAQPALNVTAPTTLKLLTGLTDGAKYSARVAARNAVGTGPASVAITPVTIGPATAPGAPGAPVGTPGDGRITLAWTAPSTGSATITAFTVAPFLGSVALPTIAFFAGANPVVTGLPNGSTYTFMVRAVNAAGTGPWSSVGGPVTVGTPTAPRNVTATAGVQAATVSWAAPVTANGSPITAYVVTPYVGTVAGAPRTFAVGVTTRVVTGLTTGVSYRFVVAAKNARGTGPRSELSNPVVAG